MNFNISNDPLLYAVVIGIDTIQSTRAKPLEGAVADADRIVGYLLDSLGVQESRVRLLRNSQATRREIMAEIAGLATCPYIWPQDPILIYYAGFGTRTASNDSRSDGKLFDCLVPYDCGSPDGNGGLICGIPAFSLNAALRRVASAKRSNIVSVAASSFILR